MLLGLTCSCSSAPSEGDYLAAPDDSIVTFGVHPLTLNEPLFYRLREQIERSRNGDPIHLLKVEILGLPSWVVVDHIRAIKLPFPGHKGIPEVGDSEAVRHEYEPSEPVTDVTLTRPCPANGTSDCPAWSLIAELHMTEDRPWKSTGLRITYEVDGHQYVQEYHDGLIGASTVLEPPSLSPSPG